MRAPSSHTYAGFAVRGRGRRPRRVLFVGSVGPLFVAGLAALLLVECPTIRTLLTGIAAALGVSLVVLKATGALDVIGVAAALAATASMSAGTVLTKRWGRPEGVGPLALTGWQLTAGGLLIAPLALLVEGAPPALDGRAIGGYLYLALANTAVAYWLWFRGIGRLAATQVTFLGPLSPLTAAVVGWAVLGQSLGPVQLAGMALAFAATVLGQLGPRRPIPSELRESAGVSPAEAARGRTARPAACPGTDTNPGTFVPAAPKPPPLLRTAPLTP